MYKSFFVVLLALAAFAPLPFTSTPAYAQSQAAMADSARIDGFDVAPVKKPAPGSELIFTLYGSQGGSAAVQINGATGGVALVETEAGVYEGSYTIRQRDRITAASNATANLRLGNSVASALLDEPLVGKANANARHKPLLAPPAEVPKIDRFDIVAPPVSLQAGEELILTLVGSAGGAASARISGVKGKIVLNEVRSGVYEGRYTIKQRDQIVPSTVYSVEKLDVEVICFYVLSW